MIERRNFLKLLGGAAAAPLVMPAGGVAHAAARSQHPAIRGPLGMNLAAIDYWSSEHPFRNLALVASRWRLQENDKPFSWDFKLPPSTPAGYPLIVPPGTYLESFLIFTPHREHLPDQLTVSYEGKGVLEYLGNASLVSRKPGQDIIRDLKKDGPLMARLVSTSEADPLRNVRIFAADEQGDERFRQPFLDRLSSMSVLRFMDWMVTNNSRVSRWEERARLDRYTQTEGGVAIEIMIELCNKLKVSPWFTLPHLADDDYVKRFAELVRDTLHPDLPVHVEYSNEVWNGLFEQSAYAMREGVRLGLSSNEYEAGLRYHSQRSAAVIAAWKDVFGADRERVIGVFAAHGVNPWSSEVVLSWQDAARYADVLAVAPYFGGGMGGPDHAATTATWSLDQLFEELQKEVDGQNRDVIIQQAEIARKYDLPLVAYEGGQHLVGYSGTEHDKHLHDFFAKANRDPRMGDLYRRHIRHWQEAGGGTYVLFNSMGTYSQWGSWGLLEHESDATPKWAAVQDLLNA